MIFSYRDKKYPTEANKYENPLQKFCKKNTKDNLKTFKKKKVELGYYHFGGGQSAHAFLTTFK